MGEPISAVQDAPRSRLALAYQAYQQFLEQSAAPAVQGAPASAARSQADVLQRAEEKVVAAAVALIDQLKQMLAKAPAVPTKDASAGEPGNKSADSMPRGTSAPDREVPRPAGGTSTPQQLYQGGAAGPKDEWGDSRNVNKGEVFRQVYDGVKAQWDTGAIPQNVKDLFSGQQTDKYYQGLNLSAEPTTRAQQKAAIWELATASHETGGSYDPGKLPSYWEAGGSGTRAGQTQHPGMAPDPKGMTYGMFSTESSHPIDVSNPRTAVVADLRKFGADLAGFDGDLQKTLELIGQTDSTSVIPSIQEHGGEYLRAFEGV